MRDEAAEIVREVIASVGLQFGVSIARRAELCAERLIEVGDADAIGLVLKSGFQRELSREFSALKSAARQGRAGSDAVSRPESRNEQLSFPVIAPGMAPVPLVSATNRLIEAALDAELKQLEGRQQNVKALQRFAAVTRQWPDLTVGELLAQGLVTLVDFEIPA